MGVLHTKVQSGRPYIPCMESVSTVRQRGTRDVVVIALFCSVVSVTHDGLFPGIEAGARFCRHPMLILSSLNIFAGLTSEK
jgi:hypothetical protein